MAIVVEHRLPDAADKESNLGVGRWSHDGQAIFYVQHTGETAVLRRHDLADHVDGDVLRFDQDRLSGWFDVSPVDGALALGSRVEP